MQLNLQTEELIIESVPSQTFKMKLYGSNIEIAVKEHMFEAICSEQHRIGFGGFELQIASCYFQLRKEVH